MLSRQRQPEDGKIRGIGSWQPDVAPRRPPRREAFPGRRLEYDSARMKLTRTLVVAAALAGIAGCSAQGTSPPPSGVAPSAAVVRRQAPQSPPAAAAVPSAPSPAAAVQPVAVPPDAQYVCVKNASGGAAVTPIEFTPKVAALCRRHPEMGPCQYERNLCRRSGGRVYGADGVEITMDTEADYDRKVMRVRLKSN